jgi:hypothetical protein
MQVTVKDPAGQMHTWQVMTVGVAAMRKTGAGNKDLFKVGQTYKMQVYPARVGANRALLETITFPDGRTMSLSLN